MALAPEQTGIGIRRHFTTPGQHPYDTITWETRDARISNWKTGEVAFEQLGVEVPSTFSVNATNILAQKYFRGTLNTDERETSLKQVADRVVDTITTWGIEGGYFTDGAEAEVFNHELKYLIIHQKGAFNSPVWFNIGVKGVPQQGSACFILKVEDKMDAILNWYVEEGVIFKGGSGAGVNLSAIRSSHEHLKGGGTASGPVSFMRGADSSAGTIKSGGKTRRAAKMVMLDVDHPDIEEFIWCKSVEERKARALAAAGFDMDLDGKDSYSIQYQNANNSIRVSDEFMQAVVDDGDWELVARTDGSVVRTLKARDLMKQFSQSAWECADPGMQYDTTINRWHTSSNTDRINGSNPCSEYMHLDNSACNLASLNLLTYLNDDDTFDVDGFKSSIEAFFTAQEIIVGRADYPTGPIGDNSLKFRQLGLGYANIGALLMNLGMAYDSEEGRAYAASITALMTGHAYYTSAKTAARMGPHAGFEENKEPMLRVLGQHQAAVAEIDEALAPTNLLSAAQQAWDSTVALAPEVGVRNAQATVLAPTGTIGLLMDCDTTGIEPDLGLCKMKKLVGGGTMSIVNQSVPRALRGLGYTDTQVVAIEAYIDENKSILGAPAMDPAHYPVFACSMGDNPIHYLGHVKMMAAVQPFISGAISKTVNMPEDASVDDVEQLHIDAWRMGVKAIAIYRDNCKVGQPLSMERRQAKKIQPPLLLPMWSQRLWRRLSTSQFVSVCLAVAAAGPSSSASLTAKGFVTIGEYDDGRPARDVRPGFKAGLNNGRHHGCFRHLAESWASVRSSAPQLCGDLHRHALRASSMTDDPDIRIATSIMDYLFRKLAVLYLPYNERSELGIFTTNERTQQTLPGVEETITTTQGADLPADPPSVESASDLIDQMAAQAQSTKAPVEDPHAPICMQCGVKMQRAGSCHACPDCGNTSGCS